jgi:hypothetical protein
MQRLPLLFLCTALLLPGLDAGANVVINEIHYNPDVKTEPAEFVELYNNGTNVVNVGGWSLDSGIHYTIPAGTNMAPGNYLVIAANPAFILAKYGAKAIGPFTGGLSKYGDTVTLKDAASNVVNEVQYGLAFPWPIVGDPPGYSIELVNPNLDNSLAGSWRSSATSGNSAGSNLLVAAGSVWKYKKGTAEPSSPSTAWHDPSYDDSGWTQGATPIGYDNALAMATPLNDMSGGYTTFYVRRTFVVNDPNSINSLRLEALYDDGFKVWINGSNVVDASMPAGEVPYTGVATGAARESSNYDPFIINNPRAYLVPGTNVIALQVANVLLSGSTDAFIDVRLSSFTGTPGNGPTPGARNSVYATNAPPQIRQVAHTPEQPKSGDPVTITAKVTDPDGVASVTLEYQLVNPGSYIELADQAYVTNWTAVAMLDNGSNGDAVAGDDVYTVVLPSAFQVHRRLVRYRITVTDTGNRSVKVPYADDPQPNFAYFCYNGVPVWTGQVQPPSSPTLTVSSNEMNRIPVYHLISKSNSVLTATGWNPGAPNNQYGGDDYLWHGALIYDGKVYDHIGFRMRGGVWRYSMGKNAWKLSLNRGHDFQARDDFGNKYNAVWRRLSFRPDIQQGDFLHRGEQGMFESVGYKFFRLTGVTAPKTTHIQFRIIDDAREAPANNQYGGDFYGLYLAVEEQDGRLLEERRLPDGNIYDMEAGTGTLNHLGSLGPTDKSDLNYFLNTYTSPSPADSWWRTNLNLTSYYSYQSIIQGIHQYDIADGKNYFYYRNPVTGLWEAWPWDLDLTWADNMYRAGSSGGDEPFKSRVLSNFSTTPSHPVFNLEFKNRLREVRDLLFNNDQGYKVIDEMSALIHGPETNSITDADRCQWDYNPIMFNSSIVNLSKAGNYHFYQWSYEPGTSNNFFGAAQLMKNYMNYRISSANLGIGATGLDGLAADAQIPSRPVVTYTGPSAFPINRLTFHSSSYVGQYAFASMKWRVGEIMDSSSPLYKIGDPWIYEITPVWESGPLATFTPDITIPISAVRPGHRYRVRAEVIDVTGRASNWSVPVEFVCGEADNASDLLSYLRITEVMYNPPAGGFEFIELHNISSSTTLDLQGVKFTAGIDFTFPAGTTLAPGGFLLVVNTADYAAFRSFYGLNATVPMFGPFNSSSLNNGGETLTLKTSAGGLDIVSFTYSDARGWPLTADGVGHSLVLLDSAEGTEGAGSAEYGANWRPSTYLKGSPGSADSAPAPTVLINEIAANTEGEGGFASNDWIELYNALSSDVTLGPDWYFSDDGANLKKWQVPQPVVIPAHGFLSFDEVTGFHNPTNIGFGLDRSGEQVFLSYLPGTAQDRVVDSIRYKAQEKGWSWGRYPDGGAFWAALAPQTRNATNAAPPARVVVNEILYHPPDLFGTNDNSLDEFVEIHNPTGVPVPLYNTNGGWRIDGSISLVFPTNQMLNAGEYLLAVNFDPTNTAQLAAFKSLYGITNSSLVILGPYAGKLANSSDRVAIEKPQATDVALQPIAWGVVDEVFYADQTPWPCGSDGTGASLQRQNSLWHGSDPMIWAAAAPTAGRSNAFQISGAPTIIVQPLGRVVPVGSEVVFNVAACGNPPFTYRWQVDGNELPNQTNAVLVLTNAQIGHSGNYRVLVSNPYGSELSAIAALVVQTFPGILTQPQNQTIILSNNVSFNVSASGSPPLFYRWRFNGNDLPGATNQNLSLTNVLASQSGDYSVVVMNTAGSVVSSNATLTVLVPVQITNQPPAIANVVAGGTLNLSVGVLGSGPLSYQWFFQGNPIANATNASLALPNFQSSNSGSYRVSVSNSFSGAISTSAEVAVLEPPIFTQQPLSQTVFAGSSVTFTAAVSGSFPLGGRWLKSLGVVSNFSGLNTNVMIFRLSSVKITDAGLYRVVVTNAALPSGTNSVQATLTVLAPPAFSVQPSARTINLGSSTTFTVIANGTAPLYFQWQLNGGNVANATNASYAITNAQPSQEGFYSVTVTNSLGMTNSQPVLLTVLFPPVLTNSVMVPNTGFKMFLLGNRNYNYTLERSPDLSNWNSWGSVIYSNGPMPLTDSTATNATKSFYRVRRNP